MENGRREQRPRERHHATAPTSCPSGPAPRRLISRPQSERQVRGKRGHERVHVKYPKLISSCRTRCACCAFCAFVHLCISCSFTRLPLLCLLASGRFLSFLALSVSPLFLGALLLSAPHKDKRIVPTRSFHPQRCRHVGWMETLINTVELVESDGPCGLGATGCRGRVRHTGMEAHQKVRIRCGQIS
jgi:hypothetical protein